MGRRLDLVVVNPGGRRRVYQALASDLAAVEPPVWAGLMAEFVRRKGYSVAIVDADAEGLEPDAVAQRVDDMDPLLCAVVVYGHQPSASTQNMPAAGAICRAVKQSSPGRHVAMVGGHVAALPEQTLREEAIDSACSGEGPRTLVALLECLRSGGADLGEVPDLWYRRDDAIVHTAPAPLIKDLDHEMPGLAWDLLPMERYRAHNWHCFGQMPRQPYAAIYTTLGCPYRCTFCCIQAPFKSGEAAAGYREGVNSYRMWSVDAVMAQIGLLVEKYGVRNIKIADEMFVLHPGHVLGLCDAIIARGYDLNVWAYARVDTVREGMIDKMARAGVRWLAFGIEAADARVRDDVAKGFGQADIFNTLDAVRAAGINVIGNYIFGLPEDDIDTMQATLDLALGVNAEFSNFYSTMAYPGSALYRLALNEGWQLPETWSGYSQHSVDSLPLRTRHLSAAQVLRFRDRAFQSYFSSPSYLEMVERKFGPDTVAHVRQMAAVPLQRRFA
jgi:radical SAM superfamily enzyme YgiQ (UPF0313 family)